MQNTEQNKAKNNLIMENTTPGDTTYYRIKTNSCTYGNTFIVSSDTTNCKLSYIHGIGILTSYSKNEYKEIIDNLLDKCKGTVLINTTKEEIGEFLKDNYVHYYYHKVPIGYGNGYQYHILIKNDVRPNTYCRKPEKEVNTPDDFKANFKSKLLETLKKLRRKNDYVDELINSL